MLYEVIIPIALFQQLRSQTLVPVVEVINILLQTELAAKYIYPTKESVEHLHPEMGNLLFSKLKSSCLWKVFDKTMPLITVFVIYVFLRSCTVMSTNLEPISY